ncbi:MAG: ABC transporter substrate-binding protein [Pseudooceanicola sp.]|nr:ABC transporter substrate-binding protein [Pseudooceanicola sp.]
MKLTPIPVGFVPLVDAAPLIVADQMGFAESEGLALDLRSAPSWSALRDMVAFGRVDAAHMLAVVPVAMALGLGGVTTQLSAVSVLSVNGTVIGVGRVLEARLREQGYTFDFHDAAAAGAALAQAARGALVIGAPFPFSMHVELLRYWFAATPLAEAEIEIRTVPPPMMAQALAEGEIDAFCVGEPWGSVAVEGGSGALLLPGKAIWAFAPEKVLAVRTEWAEDEPQLLGRLMRAVWRAQRWLAAPDSHIAAAELLSRKGWLDLPSDVIDRALTGRLTVSPSGDQRHCPGFLDFHAGAASFPWRSQARWIARQLAMRHGLDPAAAADAGAKVFRTDLYRRHMAGVGAELPSASEKVEGAILHPTAVPTQAGRLTLQPDSFFDRRVFDPSA